jgi:hypothetical protein
VASSLLIAREMANFFRELRYSARSFARTPAWTLALVLTIALGIGSSASVDGFVRGLAALDTGTPEFADGIARVGRLLRVAAIAVFVMACANIASFLLSRATARARETAVRVAVGAGRPALVRQVVADSLVLAMAGAIAGAVLAFWIGRIVPALLVDEDADQMVFSADPAGIAVVAVACVAVAMACGLLPLIETRHDDPGAIMQRENSGPSRLSIRIGAGLVIVQMTACTVLVIAAGLLAAGFQSALRTSTGRQLSDPVLVTVEALQMSSKSQEANAGQEYFEAISRAARETIGTTAATWVATVPGNRPIWQTFEFESAAAATARRDIEFEQVWFTPRTVGEIVLPPTAGRLFTSFDVGACGGVVLSRAAAAEIGGSQVVGRSIELPNGEWAEVIGVVTPTDEPAAARVYHYRPGAHDSAVPSHRVTYRIPQVTGASQTRLEVNIFAPNYFQFMGLPVEAGKTFDDRKDACRVAVVNREAADLYFQGGAVGGAIIDAEGRRTSVIGVVVSPRLRITQRAVAPAVYFPLHQSYQPRMSMIAETAGVSRAGLDRLYRRIKLTPGGTDDPRRPPVAMTLDEHLSRTALAPERITAVLVTASASIALLLGMLGLYGVMSDATRRRRREFALRLALGAPGNHVIGQVVAEGLRLVVAGSVAGTIASLGVAQWLAQIAPADQGVSPLIWIAAPMMLALAVVIASVLPARRAVGSSLLMIMRAE